MMNYAKLWKPHALAKGKGLELELGALKLWVHRGDRDWHLAYESDTQERERFALSQSDAPFNPDRDWTRWFLDEKITELRMQPMLPDRPIIVRPEMPVCLMPKQAVQFFIGIPLWLGISFDAKNGRVIEIPTQRLSNSWFGTFSEGELCYAVKTKVKLRKEDLSPAVSRVVFPLEVRNASQTKLNFERLCIRPQFLSIYQGKSRLWTNKGRASYRGEENWSRMVYASTAPDFEEAGRLLGKARETTQRGSILKTFDNLKQRVDLS
ncbi:DUF432 domain-containing protein [Pontiella sp.]|uniref:DUF432 domain-containing protein n=1 Tax=Pontiella sp. TaxID=2837462 RepID=UPI0035627858